MVAPLKIAKHAAQSGHWYDEHGNQIVEVLGSSGKMVRPDLRHARKHDLARGVTSIIRLLDKPQLTRWQIRQGILAALTLPRLEAETEEAWLDRVEEDGKATAIAAADEGTRIHAAIQAHYQGQPVPDDYREHVAGVVLHLDLCLGRQEWISERGVASPLGYGTKLDAFSPEFVIDFKGRDGDADTFAGLGTYDEHAMQLAAGMQALEPGKWRRAGICYVSRTHPGVARLVEVEQPALERGFALFRHLLEISFIKDGFRPSWAVRSDQ